MLTDLLEVVLIYAVEVSKLPNRFVVKCDGCFRELAFTNQASDIFRSWVLILRWAIIKNSSARKHKLLITNYA